MSDNLAIGTNFTEDIFGTTGIIKIPSKVSTPFNPGSGYIENAVTDENPLSFKRIDYHLGGFNIQDLYNSRFPHDLATPGLNENAVDELRRGERVKIITIFNPRNTVVEGEVGEIDDRPFSRYPGQIVVLGHFLPLEEDKEFIFADIDKGNVSKQVRWYLKDISFHALYIGQDSIQASHVTGNVSLTELKVNRITLPVGDNFVNTLTNVAAHITPFTSTIGLKQNTDGTMSDIDVTDYRITVVQAMVDNNKKIRTNIWSVNLSSLNIKDVNKNAYIFQPYTSVTAKPLTIKNEITLAEATWVEDSLNPNGYFDYMTKVDTEYYSVDNTYVVNTVNDTLGKYYNLFVGIDELDSRRSVVVFGGGVETSEVGVRGTRVHAFILTDGKDISAVTSKHADYNLMEGNEFIDQMTNSIDGNLILGGPFGRIDGPSSSATFIFASNHLMRGSSVADSASYTRYGCVVVPCYLYVHDNKITIKLHETGTELDTRSAVASLGGSLIASATEVINPDLVNRVSVPLTIGKKRLKAIKDLTGSNINTAIQESKGALMDIPVATGQEDGTLSYLDTKTTGDIITVLESVEGTEYGDPQLVLAQHETGTGGTLGIYQIPFVDRRSKRHGILSGALTLTEKIERDTSSIDSDNKTYWYSDPRKMKATGLYPSMVSPLAVPNKGIVPDYRFDESGMPFISSSVLVTPTPDKMIKDGFEARTLITLSNQDTVVNGVTGDGRDVQNYYLSTNIKVEPLNQVTALDDNKRKMGYTVKLDDVRSVEKLETESNVSTLYEAVDFYRVHLPVTTKSSKEYKDLFVYLHRHKSDNKLRFITHLPGGESHTTYLELNHSIKGISKHNCSFVTLGDYNHIDDNILSTNSLDLKLYPHQDNPYTFLQPGNPVLDELQIDPFKILSLGAFVYMADPDKGSLTDIRIHVALFVILKDKGLTFLGRPLPLIHKPHVDISQISPYTTLPVDSRLYAFLQVADPVRKVNKFRTDKNLALEEEDLIPFNYVYLDIFYSRNHFSDRRTSPTLLYYARTTNLFSTYLDLKSGQTKELREAGRHVADLDEAYKEALHGALHFESKVTRLSDLSSSKHKYDKLTVINTGPRSYYMTYLERVQMKRGISANLLGKSFFTTLTGEMGMSHEEQIVSSVDPRYTPCVKLLNLPDEKTHSTEMLLGEIDSEPDIMVGAVRNTSFSDLSRVLDLDKNMGSLALRFIKGKKFKSKVKAPRIYYTQGR